MFDGIKVLVIGDVMLDKYILGEVSRISPEAPVPIVLSKKHESTLGGAANVANNLRGLGATPILCGVVGADTDAGELMSLLDSKDVSIEGIFVDKYKPTTTKTRVTGNNQQIVRIDQENTESISPSVRKTMDDFIKRTLPKVQGVIISDYAKGVVSSSTVMDIKKLNSDMIIAVDPKVSNFKWYKNATLLTPNIHEAAGFFNTNIRSDKTLKYIASRIMSQLKCKYLLITKGARGMTLFEEDCFTDIMTEARSVFDVSGAGDTVISVFTLALIAGMNPLSATELANKAGGIVVGEMGTSIITIEELIKE